MSIITTEGLLKLFDKRTDKICKYCNKEIILDRKPLTKLKWVHKNSWPGSEYWMFCGFDGNGQVRYPTPNRQ